MTLPVVKIIQDEMVSKIRTRANLLLLNWWIESVWGGSGFDKPWRHSPLSTHNVIVRLKCSAIWLNGKVAPSSPFPILSRAGFWYPVMSFPLSLHNASLDVVSLDPPLSSFSSYSLVSPPSFSLNRQRSCQLCYIPPLSFIFTKFVPS